jgi:predicted amidophosphoribosyltransferase
MGFRLCQVIVFERPLSPRMGVFRQGGQGCPRPRREGLGIAERDTCTDRQLLTGLLHALARGMTVLKFLKVCALCGVPSFGRNFCRSCFGKIEQNFFPGLEVQTENQDLLIRRLYLWRRGDRLQQHMAHALKGKVSPADWQVFATAFVRAHWPSLRSFHKPLLVPAPARTKTSLHAQGLALALSKVMGGEVWDHLLVPLSMTTHTKWERKRDRLKRLSLIAQRPCPRGRKIILVDDIVTTGSTALAARKALGDPRDFEVWCLFRRARN